MIASQHYVQKYKTLGLIAATDIRGKPRPILERARQRWCTARAKAAKNWIENLEALQDLLEEAFTCARHECFMIRRVGAESILSTEQSDTAA
jgi:hypothetical protein